jgi:hypothetical protein
MVAPGFTGRTRPTKVKKRAAVQKRKRDDVDVDKLEEAVAELVTNDFLCGTEPPLISRRIPKMLLPETSPTSLCPTQPSKASSPPISLS